LKPEEQINYIFYAKKHNVNRFTLSRRHQGIQGTRADRQEEQQLLNNQQAKTLIKEINKLSEQGLYVSSSILQNFAAEITKKQPGKNWAGHFLKKHQDKLVYRYTTSIVPA
jgi:putative methionine-R-sulfoxide reductase with GAF domain